MGIWLYHSFSEFSCEAASGNEAPKTEIHQNSRNFVSVGSNGPPIIVASNEALSNSRFFPRLEGRHSQLLPRIPGGTRGQLFVGIELPEESCQAWHVPWQVGSEKIMIITVDRNTTLILDWTSQNISLAEQKKLKIRPIRRAANVLDRTASIFAATTSMDSAYKELETVWNNKKLEDEDPDGNLLKSHAERLRHILEELSVKPRVALRTEHRLLKLQSVRRTDGKTVRWLATRPGRTTAERAGFRQRIKAPKRYDTRNTLENRVLRAFAALTVRVAKSWLDRSENANLQMLIRSHMHRAQRVEKMLRDFNVPEAIYPVQPNFQLRFDPRYREILKAWRQLLERAKIEEDAWMWQHRTFMNLLEVRAAMKLQEKVKKKGGGILAHAPAVREADSPDQGRFLENGSISLMLGFKQDEQACRINFRTGDGESPLGSVATANSEASVWWNSQDVQSEMVGAVGELPWDFGGEWDTKLEKWSESVLDRA